MRILLLSNDRKLERTIIVFCNWAVFGFIGLGLLLDGLARDNYLFGFAGVVGIVAGFVGHMVINRVFGLVFTKGETALGLVVFSTSVITFVLSWLIVGHSNIDFYIGLTLFATVVTGFFVYVSTRYGIRGAFTRFDAIPSARSRWKK
jgi:hypothetical protein